MDIWSASVWMPGALRVSLLISGGKIMTSPLAAPAMRAVPGATGRWQRDLTHAAAAFSNCHHFCDFNVKRRWHQGKLTSATSVTACFVPMLKD